MVPDSAEEHTADPCISTRSLIFSAASSAGPSPRRSPCPSRADRFDALAKVAVLRRLLLKNVRSLGVAAVAVLVFSSCSGGSSSSPSPTPMMTAPPAITKSFTFPAGDAVSTAGTAWDIVGVKTTVFGSGMNVVGNSYDMLRVETTFTQDVSNALPAPGTNLSLGNQLGIGVAIDSDGNPATGNLLPCQTVSQLRPFECLVDPGSRLSDGNYSILFKNQPIYSGPTNPGSEAVFTANKSTIAILINFAAIGVFARQTIPNIGVAVNAFNGNDNINTDCTPTRNSGIVEVFTS